MSAEYLDARWFACSTANLGETVEHVQDGAPVFVRKIEQGAKLFPESASFGIIGGQWLSGGGGAEQIVSRDLQCGS